MINIDNIVVDNGFRILVSNNGATNNRVDSKNGNG